MGLDLLIMPLWRYLAGQFEGPVEQYATRIGNPKPSDSEIVARNRARHVREEVERRVGRVLSWSDEGEVALAVQYHYRSLQALRAFAAYQEYPLGQPFALDAAPEDHPSLARIYYQNAPTRFRHLIDHSDCAGFYLPSEFDPPVPCFEVVDEPPDRPSWWVRLLGNVVLQLLAWGFGAGKELREERRQQKERERWIKKLRGESPYPPPPKEAIPEVSRGKSLLDWSKVGSSIRLLEELEELNRRLLVPRDWGELKVGESMAPEGDPLGDVKHGWGVLRYAARVSVERGLPIIFDG